MHIQLLDFHGQPILWLNGDFGPGAMIVRQTIAGGGADSAAKWSKPIVSDGATEVPADRRSARTDVDQLERHAAP